jgi:hypothetical protein
MKTPPQTPTLKRGASQETPKLKKVISKKNSKESEAKKDAEIVNPEAIKIAVRKFRV